MSDDTQDSDPRARQRVAEESGLPRMFGQMQYNQVDELKAQIEKLQYVIREQEAELLRLFRKLERFI